MIDAIECQKSEFSLPEGEHYINCAYMAPCSKRVEAAGTKALRSRANPASTTAVDFFEPVNQVREAFATIVGAEDPDHVAILPSVSYGMATVAKNVRTRASQEIILIEDQFPSDVYVWQRLARSAGLSIKFVQRPTELSDIGSRWSQRIIDCIHGNTVLVCVPHVHWADGTRFELDEISGACQRWGSMLVVDGSQSIGAMPFDARTIQADAVICAGYKWLTGPYGMSLGLFGPRLLEGTPLEENWIVRKDSENFAALVNYQDDYQSGAIRFDVGERSNFILIPMMNEALRQIIRWSPVKIQQYCVQLTRDPVEQLRQMGYKIHDPGSRGAHLLGIRLPEGTSVDRVRSELAALKVHVSIRSDAIRVSPNVYNDSKDLDVFVNAMAVAGGGG